MADTNISSEIENKKISYEEQTKNFLFMKKIAARTGKVVLTPAQENMMITSREAEIINLVESTPNDGDLGRALRSYVMKNLI